MSVYVKPTKVCSGVSIWQKMRKDFGASSPICPFILIVYRKCLWLKKCSWGQLWGKIPADLETVVLDSLRQVAGAETHNEKGKNRGCSNEGSRGQETTVHRVMQHRYTGTPQQTGTEWHRRVWGFVSNVSPNHRLPGRLAEVSQHVKG